MIRRPPRSPLFPYPPLSRSEPRLPRLRDHSRHTARRHAEPDGEALGGESHEPCLDGEDPEPHRGALLDIHTAAPQAGGPPGERGGDRTPPPPGGGRGTAQHEPAAAPRP